MNIALLLNNTYDHLLQNGDLIVLRGDIDISKAGKVKDGKIIYKDHKYSIQSYINARININFISDCRLYFRIKRNRAWLYVDRFNNLMLCRRYYPFYLYFKHGDILIVRFPNSETRLLYDSFTESFKYNGKMCTSITSLISEFRNYSYIINMNDIKVKRGSTIMNMNNFVPNT